MSSASSITRALELAGNLVRRVAEAPIPDEVRFLKLSQSGAAGHLLRALVDLGIPEVLADGPVDVPRIATRLRLHAPSLNRLLVAAESIGVVECVPEGYRLTRLGGFLVPTTTLAGDAWVRHHTAPAVTRAWEHLADSVRTGRSAFELAHQMTWEEWREGHHHEAVELAAARRGLIDLDGSRLAAMYPWPSSGTVCEVRGGVGTFLSHVLQQAPGLHGVVVDDAEAVAQAPDFLASRGLADRAEGVAIGAYEAPPVVADHYVLRDVLHTLGDPEAGKVLAAVRSAMTVPHARLVIFEMLNDATMPSPVAPLLDIEMFTLTGGRQRSLAEVEELLEGAGLTLTRTFWGQVHSVVEAAVG